MIPLLSEKARVQRLAFGETKLQVKFHSMDHKRDLAFLLMPSWYLEKRTLASFQLQFSLRNFEV